MTEEEGFRKFVVTTCYPEYGLDRRPVGAWDVKIDTRGYLVFFRQNGREFLRIAPAFWAELEEVEGEEQWL